MGRSNYLVTAACVAVLWSTSCVEKTDHVSPIDRKAVERFVSTTAPSPPQHPVGAKLGDQIELLGYDVRPAELTPGETFTVTWHWKVDKKVGPGWMLFTHLSDASGKDRLNQDRVGPVRRAYPPAAWKGGEYIRDPQTIRLPKDWNSPSVTFYVGVWKGDMRLPVVKGPQDGTHRLRAATLPVKGEEKPIELPELVSRKVKSPPKLDGKLDDAAWKGAARTDRLVNTLNGKPAEPPAHVRTAWDDEALYIAFEVQDPLLKSSFEKHDDHLWEQDCVEVMLDPNGDAKDYFELQVSPRGTVFDTRYDTRRKPPPFGHVDWNAQLQNGVQVNGTLDDTEADEGYTVEMAIPWKVFAPEAKPGHGDSWRINFYVLDAQKDGQRGVGWSPPGVRDYHVPGRFGHVRFQDPDAPADEEKDAPAKAEEAEEASEASKSTERAEAPKAKPAASAPAAK